MTTNYKIGTRIVVFSAFLLTNCAENEFECRNNRLFCNPILSENFEESGTVIDEFLQELPPELSSQEKLEKLRDWLKCKSCVSHVEIFCNSCIYTLPPISELKITFILGGRETDKFLDIIMSEPLRFVGYHN
ncbi:hypothetical protein [Shivajiella indica]|uniref:Uncharacterized protein n=1 Tax=Shivajiella indica TaxID=872115 RepID=A0ABW5BCC9_9BACT